MQILVFEGGALREPSIGELAQAISQRLAYNEEIKIKQSVVRVQHVSHYDKLNSANSIDAARSHNTVDRYAC